MFGNPFRKPQQPQQPNKLEEPRPVITYSKEQKELIISLCLNLIELSKQILHIGEIKDEEGMVYNPQEQAQIVFELLKLLEAPVRSVVEVDGCIEKITRAYGIKDRAKEIAGATPVPKTL